MTSPSARLRSAALLGVALGVGWGIGLGGAPARGADESKPPATAAAAASASAVVVRPARSHSLPEVVRTEEGADATARSGNTGANAGAGAGANASPPGAHRPSASAAAEPWTAATIDALIDRQLDATKATRSPVTSDEAFLRRAYLDITGRPPELVEIRRFATARGADKRGALIDALLKDPAFGRNWARYWRDVVAFRAPSENERRLDYPQFVDWLAGQFNENVPWNTIATRVITATGRSDENGATIFALAEEAEPVELAGEVSRVFLGIQIQCAQCHDHPSDPWKRQQFHEFAAFFGGIKKKQVQRPVMGQKAIFQVNANGPARYSMVDLKDPEKKIPITPRFFLGDGHPVAEATNGAAKLQMAADYVTSPANPWFARAFVNRTWSVLMGEGFYDLVDDLGPTRTANSAALLDGLANAWREHDYDIRWLFTTILKTDAYARESRPTSSQARAALSSNVASRLRADQIFDAMDQAFNLDQIPANRANARAMAPDAKRKGAAAKADGAAMMKEGEDNAVEEQVRKVVDNAFGVDPSMPSSDVVGTIPQALYMMNSALVTRSVLAKPGTMLGSLLAEARSPREAVNALYLKTLARHPNAKEMAVSLRHLDLWGNEGYEDLLWSLVNSTEFISRR